MAQQKPNPSRPVQRTKSGLPRQGPLHPGGHRHHARALKREMAQERQNLRNQRTAEQQIAELDRRLGVGIGAAKERRRLLDLIKVEK